MRHLAGQRLLIGLERRLGFPAIVSLCGYAVFAFRAAASRPPRATSQSVADSELPSFRVTLIGNELMLAELRYWSWRLCSMRLASSIAIF